MPEELRKKKQGLRDLLRNPLATGTKSWPETSRYGRRTPTHPRELRADSGYRRRSRLLRLRHVIDFGAAFAAGRGCYR